MYGVKWGVGWQRKNGGVIPEFRLGDEAFRMYAYGIMLLLIYTDRHGLYVIAQTMLKACW
jgi:hypothetical protein